MGHAHPSLIAQAITGLAYCLVPWPPTIEDAQPIGCALSRQHSGDHWAVVHGQVVRWPRAQR